MTAALLAGMVAGYGVAIPVGAIAPLLMSLTARTSLRVGAAAALGVATADGVYALVAVLGGASLGRWIEPAAVPLRWAAFVILLGLAAKTAFDAIRQHRARTASPGSPQQRQSVASPEGAGFSAAAHGETIGDRCAPRRTTASPEEANSAGGLGTPGRAFFGLLGLTLLNPTTILYFGALVVGWQASGGYNGWQGAVWTAAVFVASASWQLSLAGGGALLGRTLNRPRGRLWTALISSAMIAGLAGTVLIK